VQGSMQLTIRWFVCRALRLCRLHCMQSLACDTPVLATWRNLVCRRLGSSDAKAYPYDQEPAVGCTMSFKPHELSP
jgi:hypothetical protein